MELSDGLDSDVDKLAPHLFNDSIFSGNMSALDEEDGLLPTGVKITVVALYCIVCVVGLVGNSLVMYVIIR